MLLPRSSDVLTYWCGRLTHELLTDRYDMNSIITKLVLVQFIMKSSNSIITVRVGVRVGAIISSDVGGISRDITIILLL
jgi:hypothetical protein